MGSHPSKAKHEVGGGGKATNTKQVHKPKHEPRYPVRRKAGKGRSVNELQAALPPDVLLTWLSDIFEFYTMYDVVKTIGKGSYGKVFRVDRKSDRRAYALKLVRATGDDGVAQREGFSFSDIFYEVSLHAPLLHPNIALLEECFIAKSCGTEEECFDFVMVMEVGERGTLAQHLQNRDSVVTRNHVSFKPHAIHEDLSEDSDPSRQAAAKQYEDEKEAQSRGRLKLFMSEREAKYVMRQLVCAVGYLHEEALIMHRDIKPSNVLLTRKKSRGRRAAKVAQSGEEFSSFRSADLSRSPSVRGEATCPDCLPRLQCLVCSKVRVLLTDFGLAVSFRQERASSFCGSFPFIAPEVVKVGFATMGVPLTSSQDSTVKRSSESTTPDMAGRGAKMSGGKSRSSSKKESVKEGEQQQEQHVYTEMCDMWSLGVIMFELLFGKSPIPFVHTPDRYDTYRKILEMDSTLADAKPLLSDSAFELLTSLLASSPSDRPNCAKALAYEWFDDAEVLDHDKVFSHTVKWK